MDKSNVSTDDLSITVLRTNSSKPESRLIFSSAIYLQSCWSLPPLLEKLYLMWYYLTKSAIVIDIASKS